MKVFTVKVLCVAWIAIQANGNIDLPFYGPKLCSRLCQRKWGCTEISFNEILLSCSLIYSNTSQIDADRLNVLTLKVDKPGKWVSDLACPSSSIKFLNRKGQVLCRDPNPVPPPLQKAPEQKPIERIFTYGNSTLAKTKMDEIYINNRTLQTYPISFDVLVILAYVPTTKLMLITETQDRLLHTISLYGKKSNQIEQHVSCLAVANDIVFYVKDETLLYRMSLNFSMKTKIRNLYNRPPVLMAADTNRKELYMIRDGHLYRTSYGGKKIKSSFLERGGVNCFDMSRGVLYHVAESSADVIAINLTIFKGKTMTSTETPIIAMCTLKNKLFLITIGYDLVLYDHTSHAYQYPDIHVPYERYVDHDKCFVINQ